MADTKRCPNCGEVNDISNAVCQVCQTPLTAYGGQLVGEAYQGKLAQQASATEGRPPSVIAMTVYNLAFALFGLGLAVKHFIDRPTINEEGSNAIQAATSTFSAVIWAIFLIPMAIALIWLAICTWTQRTWTWNANAAGLGLFAFLSFISKGPTPTLKALYVGVAVILGIFWFLPKTKAWFGLT